MYSRAAIATSKIKKFLYNVALNSCQMFHAFLTQWLLQEIYKTPSYRNASSSKGESQSVLWLHS